MTVLLILAVVWVVGFGYYLMGRIDKFFNTGTPAETIHEDSKKVLVFASDEGYASLKTSLKDKKIPFITTAEPEIPDHMQIITVLAISDNDLDNLLLCSKARHLFRDVYTIAKCNDALYQDVFNNSGVQRIINSHCSEDSIMAFILNSSVQGLDPTSIPDDGRITK